MDRLELGALEAGSACQDFPARRNEFPVRAKHFPVPGHRELAAMVPEEQGNFDLGSA